MNDGEITFADLVTEGLIKNGIDDLFAVLPKKCYVAATLGINMAVDAHNGQFRRDGTPYVLHPLETLGNLVTLSSPKMGWYNGNSLTPEQFDLIIAALLHDVLEDSKTVGANEITSQFGVNITRMVTSLTKKPGLSKGEYAAGLWNGPTGVIDIKVADRIHNLSTAYNGNPPASWVAKYIGQTYDEVVKLLSRADRGMASALMDGLWEVERKFSDYEKGIGG